MFVTSDAHPGARFKRPLAAGNLPAAEAAATQAYLHPSRDDLAQALSRLQVVKLDPDA